MSQRSMIGVIGSSDSGGVELSHAERVGALIAESGLTLVCGGMGGVMEAACRGARSKRGMTVGILPGDRKDSGNSYLDIVVPTGMGYARNLLVVLSSSGVVAVGGKYGTLSEIAFCLMLGVPPAGIRSWRLREEKNPDGLSLFDTPEAALEAILKTMNKF